jgi:hypothetical protein
MQAASTECSGFGREHLGMQFAARLEFRDQFQDRRLRRDRIDRDHFGPGEPRRPGGGMVAVQEQGLAVAHRSSSCSTIEPVGHSRTQMPQPLQ